MMKKHISKIITMGCAAKTSGGMAIARYGLEFFIFLVKVASEASKHFISVCTWSIFVIL